MSLCICGLLLSSNTLLLAQWGLSGSSSSLQRRVSGQGSVGRVRVRVESWVIPVKDI